MDLSAQHIRDSVIKMASATESIVRGSVKREVDSEELYELEMQINSHHKDIDDNCFKFIALKTPAARDLRTIIAIMKINSDLERIADQGISIKRYHQRIQHFIKKFDQLHSMVMRALQNAIDSFVRSNSKMAIDIIKGDQEINDLYIELIEDCVRKMRSEHCSFEDGLCHIWIAKNFERIGDQCTNIAEDTIFIDKGNDVRHTPNLRGEKKRSRPTF